MRRKKAKKQGHYCLVYDREGRCTWETPTSAMNGVPMQIVEVVTKADRKEYLVFKGYGHLLSHYGRGGTSGQGITGKAEKALWRGASCPDRRRIH